MADHHGLGTILYDAAISSTAQQTSKEFVDDRVALHTQVLCYTTAGSGTSTVLTQKKLLHSGDWIEVDTTTIAAGDTLAIQLKYPVGYGRVLFTPGAAGGSVEIEMRSYPRK